MNTKTLRKETGFKDKNGNMIYEGDTIICEHCSAVLGQTCTTTAIVTYNDFFSSYTLFTKLLVFLKDCWNIEVVGILDDKVDGYVCSCCGKSEVRLYRQYQTCADAIELLCRACALKDQKKENPDSDTEHTIGWLVAAVPTKDGSYWGYTSVPQRSVDWWNGLNKE